jgi:5'-nucleotidase
VVGRANGAAATRTDVPFSYPKDLSAAGTLLASSTPVAPAAAATASKPSTSTGAFAAAAPIAAFAPPKAPPGVAPALALPVASASIASPPADAVVSDVETATVVQGDNLWDLARRFYGDGTRFRRIYEANAAQIRVPSLIYIGQQLVVPKQPPP